MGIFAAFFHRKIPYILNVTRHAKTCKAKNKAGSSPRARLTQSKCSYHAFLVRSAVCDECLTYIPAVRLRLTTGPTLPGAPQTFSRNLLSQASISLQPLSAELLR